MKELKRRKDEDESRRRQEEIEKATPVRHHTDRPEGERGDSGSIKSGSEYIRYVFPFCQLSQKIGNISQDLNL